MPITFLLSIVGPFMMRLYYLADILIAFSVTLERAPVNVGEAPAATD